MEPSPQWIVSPKSIVKKASQKDRHRERDNSPLDCEESSQLGIILWVISRNDKLRRPRLCKERGHVSVGK
jgi:hypothetical protein